MIWRSRDTSKKIQIIKVMFNIQYHKGNIKYNMFWYELVKYLLYFVESAAALNELLYLLLKSGIVCCKVRFYVIICI